MYPIIIIFAITVIFSFILYLVIVRYYNRPTEKIKHWFRPAQFLYYFTTPILSLFAALLTFFVFTMQLQLIERQKETSSKEQFDRYFLTHLQTHERNLRNISISDKISGKASFHFMFFEFKTLLKILKKTEQSFYGKDVLSFENSVIITFYCLRDGIACSRKNSNTIKSIHDRFNGEYDFLVERYIEKICDIQQLNRTRFGIDGKVDKNKAKNLCSETEFLEEYICSNNDFDIADGHYSNLSTYIQSVKSTLIFFEKNKENGVLQKDDYEYYMELWRNQFIPNQLYIVKLYGDYFVEGEDKLKWQKWFSEDKIDFFKYMPQDRWNRIKLDWEKLQLVEN